MCGVALEVPYRSSPSEETIRPDPAPSRRQVVDPLGLGAGIDPATPHHPARRALTRAEGRVHIRCVIFSRRSVVIVDLRTSRANGHMSGALCPSFRQA